MSKAQTAEERKAVSMNVMHGSTGITDEIYMRMSSDQVSDIISSFSFDESEIKTSVGSLSDNPLVNALNGLDADMLMKMSKIFESAASSQTNNA
jgi:hypothetical protein